MFRSQQPEQLGGQLTNGPMMTSGNVESCHDILCSAFCFEIESLRVNSLWWSFHDVQSFEVVVCFVDVVRIVYHHCLNFLLIIVNKQNMLCFTNYNKMFTIFSMYQIHPRSFRIRTYIFF